MDKFLKDLKSKEKLAVVKVTAFMSYNPSIGRVLSKGGVKKFEEMVVRKVKKLNKIKSLSAFDRFHSSWINEFSRKIKTNSGRRCSYGQSQKAVNVFLKLYIDRAKLPDKITAKKVTPFLHVPLDSILMKTIRAEYPDFYEDKIKPVQLRNNRNCSLSKIDKTEYLKWQEFFRDKYPKKPLLFDLAWAINR